MKNHESKDTSIPEVPFFDLGVVEDEGEFSLRIVIFK